MRQARILLATLLLAVSGAALGAASEDFAALLDEFERSGPACLLGSGYRDDPTGFGRVVRDAEGRFEGIVEEKDATDAQRKISEVNLSCYVFQCRELLATLDQLSNANAQGEYYITDCPGILLTRGRRVEALDGLKPCESLSINSMEDLALVEAEMRGKAVDP